ncbi:MAG: helix-turn-helix domain-containing protein [Deltaproteobacteria bacterium]|nr:helix-turn-helix domain-containing protein [Deltaproteobacteria bacterium]
MKKELFDELLEGVKQGAAIMKGTMKPLRTIEFPESQVLKIREQYGLSQDKFATLMGISVATLCNWEQGLRKPEGPARFLLRVAATHPDALLDMVGNKRLRKQA